MQIKESSDCRKVHQANVNDHGPCVSKSVGKMELGEFDMIFRLKNGVGMAWSPLTIQGVGTIVLGDRLGNILKARVGKQLNHGSSVVLFEGLLV